MQRIVDLRSDTVTQPTTAMRAAMARAEVGDDVFGEDPTVNRLEEISAARMGKEAGLFLVSGTMGNLIGVLSHCQRGDEVLVGAEAHIFWYEVAGTAVVGGVQLRTLPDEDGALEPAAVEEAIRSVNVHFPRTALVCLENTHNRRGGMVITPSRTRAVAEVAHRHDVRLHLDGARIFNAAVALGVAPGELAAEADSVSFCLSKGLSAPVGSLLCGSRDYIARARKLRKMLGGGMRQAGVIAAAGIVALEQMVDRLAEDHENARLLATGLANLPGMSIDLGRVETNIVIVTVKASDLATQRFVAALSAEGVKCTWLGGRRIRLVTHFGIDVTDISAAIATFRRVLTGVGSRQA